ncbi:MAG: PspC domain-containing protein [Marinoscillum sp.]
MKKTVSINIGGIIFHIEEDGYDKLKNYLDSVNKYFSTFEDSAEIIADIESRIAEIFLSKLEGGRQTVNIEDVQELIATMGTTSDFEATIESEPEEEKSQSTSTKEEEQKEYSESTESTTGTRKLHRDTKRRILGGVASGIAHYFKIDPLWVRLLIIIMFINIFFGGLSGAIFLAYIILWIVLPPSDHLEEDKKVKKLFRNGDDRVVGGIASGIAAYFGTDTAVIRLLFVLSIFLGGSGLILYIILWIITPEAKSITEKMQMTGEPVTLSNIEDNVKKGLNVREGEESPLVKILLFPFRLIALILTGIGKALGPIMGFLVQLLRIGLGVFLFAIGFVIMISMIISALALFGIGTWDYWVHTGDFPLELIRRSLDQSAIISAFLVGFIPALALSLLGFVIILKKRVANAYVGWALFGVWIIALIISAISIPNFVREFASEDDVRVEKEFEVTQVTPTLRLNEIGHDTFDAVELQLRGHEDSTYQALVYISSRGRNRQSAEQNAGSVVYTIEEKGGDLYFDSKITYPEDVPYRFQTVSAVLYIPYGKTFRMDRDLTDILENIGGYRYYQAEGNDWVFERDGLKCLTCPSRSSQSYRSDDDDDRRALDQGVAKKKYADADELVFPFEDFDEIKIASYFDVDISQGEEWSVMVRGEDNYLDEVYLNQVGDRLEVKYREDNWRWWKDRDKEKLALIITMPNLEYLQMTGNCEGEIRGFDNKELTIDLTGASELFIDVKSRDLELKLTGASKVELRGEGENLDIELIGASQYEGFRYEARRVSVDAIGASKAEVYGSEEIDIDAAGVSKVKYRGTSNVNISKAGITNVTRD